MKVVPLKKQADPDCAYFVAYQVEGGDMQVICEGLEAMHLLIIRKCLEEMENYLVGDTKRLTEG